MIGTRYCPKCKRMTVHNVKSNINAECVHCKLVRTPEEIAHDTCEAKRAGIQLSEIPDVEVNRQ